MSHSLHLTSEPNATPTTTGHSRHYSFASSPHGNYSADAAHHSANYSTQTAQGFPPTRLPSCSQASADAYYYSNGNGVHQTNSNHGTYYRSGADDAHYDYYQQSPESQATASSHYHSPPDAHYPPQYLSHSTRGYYSKRPTSPGFIPTPSELAVNYLNDQRLALEHSVTPPGMYAHPYKTPTPIVPSSVPPPTRLSTNRPRSSTARSTSPTSASPTGERFPCNRDGCTKTFSRSHDRKRHYETHHDPNAPLHTCPICGRKFSRQDSLKRHQDNGCPDLPSPS